MAIITPDKFIALKTLVKNECLRRSSVGSVAEYGGSDYDFSRTPVTGDTVAEEFYEKIAVPLNAINGTTPTSGDRIISETELDAYTETVTALSNIELQASSSGCASSCTGLCQGCTGSCTGCSGSCSGGCSGCSGSCSGCSGTCSGRCTGSCTGGCGDSCNQWCSINCWESELCTAW